MQSPDYYVKFWFDKLALMDCNFKFLIYVTSVFDVAGFIVLFNHRPIIIIFSDDNMLF